MKSFNRRQCRFSDLPVGCKLQIVCIAMGAALPNSVIFEKIEIEDGYNAIRMDTMLPVTVREDSLVEIVI